MLLNCPPTGIYFRSKGFNCNYTFRRGTDFLVGSLPAATGRKMHFTGTTVLKLKNGKIVEEVGLDDGVTALQQLGLIVRAG